MYAIATEINSVLSNMPIHLKPRKSKKGVTFKIKEYDHSLEYQVKEIFIGHNTLFSLLGFVVGGILVGRSFWEYGKLYLGLPLTTLIGVIIFTISGVVLNRFHK